MAAPLDIRRKQTSVIEFLFLRRLNAANIHMGLVNVSVKADLRRLVGRLMAILERRKKITIMMVGICYD